MSGEWKGLLIIESIDSNEFTNLEGKINYTFTFRSIYLLFLISITFYFHFPLFSTYFNHVLGSNPQQLSPVANPGFRITSQLLKVSWNSINLHDYFKSMSYYPLLHFKRSMHLCSFTYVCILTLSCKSFHKLHQIAKVSVTHNSSKTIIREKEKIIFIWTNDSLWKENFIIHRGVFLLKNLSTFLHITTFFPLNSFGPNWIIKTRATFVPKHIRAPKTLNSVLSQMIKMVKR